MLWIIRYIILLSVSVLADECLCNIKGVTEVWANANKHGQPLGVLQPSECKPLVVTLHGHTKGFWEIHFENKIGYVETSANVHNQTCSAEVTTQITHTTEETTVQTTLISTMANTSPYVMANGCPGHLQEDALKYGGFIERFGSYCYELVNIYSVWNHSEEHCKFTSTEGHLLRIINEPEQKFIQQLLSNHHYNESVWIGLSDHDAEGVLQWTTGDNVTYTNFQEEFHNHTDDQHRLNDCFLLKNNGEWTDVPCGIAVSYFFGFGEKHPFICQYKLTSTKPSLMDIVSALIG